MRVSKIVHKFVKQSWIYIKSIICLVPLFQQCHKLLLFLKKLFIQFYYFFLIIFEFQCFKIKQFHILKFLSYFLQHVALLDISHAQLNIDYRSINLFLDKNFFNTLIYIIFDLLFKCPLQTIFVIILMKTLREFVDYDCKVFHLNCFNVKLPCVIFTSHADVLAVKVNDNH